MSYPYFRSIRTKLLVLVFISLLPAFVLIFYSGVKYLHRETQEARDNALKAVQSLAYDHERTVESTRQFLMTLARLPDVQNKNPSACGRLFRTLLKQNPVYTNIFVANADGKVFSSALPFTPFSIEERNYFRDIQRTKGFAVGEYMVGIASRRPVLPLAYPVLDSNGRIKAVVVTGLDLNHYGRIFTKTSLPEGSMFAVSDHNNIRLYRSHDPEQYIGKADSPDMIKHMSGRPEGVFRSIGSDGKKYLIAYKKFYLQESPSPYLFMRVGIPEVSALAEVRNIFSAAIALMALSFVAAMVLAWSMGKVLIVQRLNKLVEVSQRLRHGDLTARTGRDRHGDELSHVSKTFDDMAEELERRESERKRAGEELRKSEERYRRLIETTTDLVYMTDRRGMYTYVNPRFEETTGYPLAELKGRPFTDVIAPEFIRLMGERFKKGMRGETISTYETELVRKDHARISMEFSSTTLYGEDGKPVGRFGIGRDITERKRAEEALRKSEGRFRLIFERFHVVMLLVDPDSGKIVDANPAAADFYGCSRDELRRMNVTDINQLAPEEIDAERRRAKQSERTYLILPHRLANGEIRTVEVHASPIEMESQVLLFSLIHDITARRKAEETLQKAFKDLEDTRDMLVQSEKLASIGLLASGTAHEILNPLNILSLRLQMLGLKQHSEGELKKSLGICAHQIDRIVKIVSGLRKFSRIPEKKLSLIRIGDLLDNVLNLSAARLKAEDVTAEVHCEPDLPILSLDKDALEQVFFNLITNAMDAMKGRERRRLTISAESRGGTIRVTISDTGNGISRENLQKLFDPFFTTKDPDKGTGLGLYITYGIIQNHGGRIWAENNDQGGASFFIELPVREDTPSS